MSVAAKEQYELALRSVEESVEVLYLGRVFAESVTENYAFKQTVSGYPYLCRWISSFALYRLGDKCIALHSGLVRQGCQSSWAELSLLLTNESESPLPAPAAILSVQESTLAQVSVLAGTDAYSRPNPTDINRATPIPSK